jgi:hypothetical protein
MIKDSLILIALVLFSCVFLQAKTFWNHSYLKFRMYWEDMVFDLWEGDSGKDRETWGDGLWISIATNIYP